MRYYVHIPFCASKCKYCSFSSFSGKNEEAKREYLDFLIKEIEKKLAWKYEEIESIYFWGWTPSQLRSEDIWNIMWIFKKYWNIEKAEITLECNPQDIWIEHIEQLKTYWINRISVWVQSLNENTLKEIWRCEKNIILEAFDILNKSWIENIWADFIIWLPHAWIWQVKRDIKELITNFDFIKHISVYLLEDWNYPNSWKDYSISEDEYLQEYNNVYEALSEAWFKRYEISNYAKNGFECRHNMAYWKHEDYIWFWLWASSFIRDKRSTNASDFKNYYCNKWFFEENLSRRELELEEMMFLIRTTGIPIDKVQDKNIVQELEKEGFIKIDTDNIILSPSWILLADFILSKLI